MIVKRLTSLLLLILSACQPSSDKPEQTELAITSGTPVENGYQITFPDDHGIHQSQGIEWWYVTANLTSETGETYGVQWTLFRTLVPSQIESTWWDGNLYFAHFAMQHEQKHVAFERFARAEQAKITSAPFKAVIDDWQLKSKWRDFLPLQLTAAENDYQVSLTLDDSPITFHGQNGYSQKTQNGHASYYFSYPFLKVTGKLTFSGEEHSVTGHAWYDREWSASLLDRNQVGWDWFSLVDHNLQKGLMLFCIRGKNNVYENCSATLIDKKGEGQNIKHQNIKLSVLDTVLLDDKTYPQKWRVNIPEHAPIIIETVTKDSRNQLTIPYWEGRILSSGGFVGRGYGEVTGS